MLRKRKEPKRKSIALSLMRDVQGSVAEKLRMFEKVRASGGFANEDPADIAEADKMLRVSLRRWRREVERSAPTRVDCALSADFLFTQLRGGHVRFRIDNLCLPLGTKRLAGRFHAPCLSSSHLR